MTAAVFDLDGTLLPGRSAEWRFLRHLAGRHLLTVSGLGSALAQAATLPLLGPGHALRRNKRWLAGARVDAVRIEAAHFVRALVPDLRRRLTERIGDLRTGGCPVYLLTGTLGPIAEALADQLGLDGWVATELETQDGRYTGRMAGPHCFGTEKVRALRSLAAGEGLDLTRSFGFADREADVAFLACFGHPVAVWPDRGLDREARSRGWEVVT